MASLSKTFVSAVKQQQSICVYGFEFTGLSDTFTVDTQANLSATFQHITNLDLQGVDTYCCGLLLESSKGALSRQNSLACVTAGSVQLLRGLAFFAPGLPAKEQPLSGETDRTMMSLLPELELLEMYEGVVPLLVPFHGTRSAYTEDRRQFPQGCSCALC